MRLFLLVSALGAAHAQLMPYSAWPMRGRNALHAANGIGAALDNNVAVFTYNLTGMVRSSPAVGTDGTVYVGSDDGCLYALSADGSTKWKYKTGGDITSSPALGFEGTVYVGSGDGYLYALHGADGSFKWKHKTEGAVSSSPAVSAEDIVYFGSDDGYLYALNGADGILKMGGWKYKTGGAISSSPAVAHGIVYFGSEDGFLYALNATNGNHKWKYRMHPARVYTLQSTNTQCGPKHGACAATLYTDVNEDEPSGWPWIIAPCCSWLGWCGTTWDHCSSSVGSGSQTDYSWGGNGDYTWCSKETWQQKYPNSVASWDKVSPTAINSAVGAPAPSQPWCSRSPWLERRGSSPTVGANGTVYVGSEDGTLYALNAINGSLKWNYKTGGSIHSSPAVGADGTVYVGSDDGYVYALQAASGNSPNVKGKYKTGAAVSSSPALSADGNTVYVGSQDGYLYALHADDCSFKWKYETGAAVYSSPALGFDGAVYVGSNDNHLYVIGLSAGHVTSSLYFAQSALARNESALPQLERLCSFNSSIHRKILPYVTSTSTERCQFELSSSECRDFNDANPTSNVSWGVINERSRYDVNYPPSGKEIVNLEFQNMSKTPYLPFGCQWLLLKSETRTPPLRPRDITYGSFIYNTDNEGDKTLNYETARGDYSRRVCAGRHYIGTFPHETVELVSTACQLLTNTRNSPSYGRSWWSFVDPLSFIEYRQLISPSGTIMTLLVKYENDLKSFEKAKTTITDRIAIARDAVNGYDADAQNWQGALKRDTSIMHAYGKEIVNLGLRMNSKFDAIQTVVHKLIGSIHKQIIGLTARLNKAKKADEVKGIFSIFKAVFKVFKAITAVASCLGEAVETGGVALLACGPKTVNAISGAVTAVKACVNTFQSCEPCKKLKTEMDGAEQAEQDIDALVVMSKAAQALNAQLSTGKDLPEALPLLISDKIAMDTLRADADLLRQELVKEAGKDGTTVFESDIRDWTELGVTRVSLFFSYYNIATHVQNDAGALKALHMRNMIVADRLKDEQNKEAAVVSASFLMYERQHTQAMLVTKYLYEEFKQYHYFSLEPIDKSTIVLPDNPQSTDLLKMQQDLDIRYAAEIRKQKNRNLAWIYVEVNQAAEPSTLASMRKGSASVVLPIPLKSATDPVTLATRMVADTNYYQMRLHDVRVYLLDESGSPFGGNGGQVQVSLSTSGPSSFFDSSFALNVFTHEPVKLGTGDFVYNSKTGCPLSASYCGDLCPNYVRYSPFGKWNVQVFDPIQQKVDLSKLASIRFEFQVDYEEGPGFSRNLFGLDPDVYPQNFGTLCSDSPRFDDADKEEL